MSTDLNPAWITDSRLWLVLDQLAAAPRSPAEICELCIPAGVDAILCRLRNLSFQDALSLATPAREVCQRLQVPFIVSHDPILAEAVAADGLQFGKADGPVEEMSDKAGEGMAWGYSAHSLPEAKLAIENGAGWVFLGPVFATPEKLKYGSPLGLEAARSALRSDIAARLILIGGINQETLPSLCELGVGRIAAISALQRCIDPAVSAKQLHSMLHISGNNHSDY